MKRLVWAIAVAVVGAIAFIFSGILKDDNSGILGVLGQISWLAFLLAVLVLTWLGVTAFVRYIRGSGAVSRA